MRALSISFFERLFERAGQAIYFRFSKLTLSRRAVGPARLPLFQMSKWRIIRNDAIRAPYSVCSDEPVLWPPPVVEPGVYTGGTLKGR